VETAGFLKEGQIRGEIREISCGARVVVQGSERWRSCIFFTPSAALQQKRRRGCWTIACWPSIADRLALCAVCLQLLALQSSILSQDQGRDGLARAMVVLYMQFDYQKCCTYRNTCSTSKHYKYDVPGSAVARPSTASKARRYAFRDGYQSSGRGGNTVVCD
jgi:hypothetical protein